MQYDTGVMLQSILAAREECVTPLIRRGRTLVALAMLGGCAPVTLPAQLSLPFVTDTVRRAVVAPGVDYTYAWSPTGPWAVHVLHVDRTACYLARASKTGDGAIGRATTLEIIRSLGDAAVAGVNADFFLFSPPGIPTGAMVSDGRVITGPAGHPVLAFDSLGAPHILTLRSSGEVAIAGERIPITGWNRRVANGVAYIDRSWGALTDTASSAVEIALGGSPLRIESADTALAGIPVPSGGAVLVARGSAATALRQHLADVGARAAAAMSLQPWHPAEAVGGRPVLVRDSSMAHESDTATTSFARSRHPRTAVGIADDGRRLILVVVDGRQRQSDGMTLRELATLMLALGARDAINLDGGGSSTMVARDSSGRLRVMNAPSDPTGERPVGNALAIMRGCRR